MIRRPRVFVAVKLLFVERFALNFPKINVVRANLKEKYK